MGRVVIPQGDYLCVLKMPLPPSVEAAMGRSNHRAWCWFLTACERGRREIARQLEAGEVVDVDEAGGL